MWVMYCETCPVRGSCRAYKVAVRDEEGSYHPQQVVRVSESDCPLYKFVKGCPNFELKQPA